MNVYIPSMYRTKKVSGKEFFCKRLGRALKDIGVNVVKSEFEKYDIKLLAGLTKKRDSAKVVFRADGVYNNVKVKYENLNRRIEKTIGFSDAIIYQSKFSKVMCEKYIGKFKGQTETIFNGFDPLRYVDIASFNSKYKYNFLTSARWRPHKRLRDIIKSFALANIDDSCLYIAGDISDCGVSDSRINFYKNKFKNIIFLGELNQEKLSSYVKMCDCFIHLCWQESCPNGVIEAIAASKPVITNNVGGTHEIVRPSGGIVCEIDKKYNLEICDLYNPPKVCHQIVADAMRKVVSSDISISNYHINIKSIAEQYLSFFEKVLSEK